MDAPPTSPVSGLGPDELKELMRPLAEQRGLDVDALNIDWATMAKASTHPLAMAQVMEGQASEPASLQAGQNASDFCLHRLDAPDAEPVTLSDSFGRKPVALVFGSYT